MVLALGRLVGGLIAVVLSASLFTNALEWLGRRLGLGHGALGSIFAALGTALPEASIAVLAALVPGAGASTADGVSIGAILGAPLLLATLGLGLLGLGALRAGRSQLDVPPRALRRDLVLYLSTFGLACLAGMLGLGARWRVPLALALVAVYLVFAWRVLQGGAGTQDEEKPRRLWFAPRRDWPSPWAIAGQLGTAAVLMLGGARLFVSVLASAAAALGLSGFVLAVLVAPLATELPETLNSVLWVGQGKDTLAAGNITGALALQGAVVPAIGLAYTPWRFDSAEVVAALVALAGGLMLLGGVLRPRRVPAWLLVSPAALYVAFVVWTLA